MIKSGAIGFFCFPEFDSPSVFASLLDERIGGSFALRPKGKEFSVKQLYVPETNLSLARFLAEDGIAELCDFMPVPNDPDWHGLIRQLTWDTPTLPPTMPAVPVPAFITTPKAPLNQIQFLLGHDKFDTTARYFNGEQKFGGEAVSKVGRHQLEGGLEILQVSRKI